MLNIQLLSDVYERAHEKRFPLPLDLERRRRLRCIANAGVLFIHIPKNAGMSVCQALYGRQIKHSTIRYYATNAPRLLKRHRSFAIVRDPVSRFVSAYVYARSGGTPENRVSLPFRARYRAFDSYESALDEVESAKSIYALDHIFRPQHWYIELSPGLLGVDELIDFDSLGDLARRIPAAGGRSLKRINYGVEHPLLPSSRQIERIRRIYARDCEIVDGLKNGHAGALM